MHAGRSWLISGWGKGGGHGRRMGSDNVIMHNIQLIFVTLITGGPAGPMPSKH